MTTRICPVCGSDYLDWVEKCTACGVALVAPAQAPDPLRLPEDQTVVYELGVWPLSLQAGAAQAMAESGIPHGWDGTDLVVHVDHEPTVDALLDALEQGEESPLAPSDRGWTPGSAVNGFSLDEARDRAPIELEAGEPGDELEYEVDEWSAEDRHELERRLVAGGVPHRWEQDDVLVIATRDEELVEAMLDEVEYPEALEPETDEDDDGVYQLMSELFLAADRLKSNPRDPDGLEGLAMVVSAADADRPPYGVDPALWERAVEEANELADRIAGVGVNGGGDDETTDGEDTGGAEGLRLALLRDSADDDEEIEDDDALDRPPSRSAVVALATSLRDLLRPYV